MSSVSETSILQTAPPSVGQQTALTSAVRRQTPAGDTEHLAAGSQNTPHKGRNLISFSVLPQRVGTRPQIISRPEELPTVCMPQT